MTDPDAVRRDAEGKPGESAGSAPPGAAGRAAGAGGRAARAMGRASTKTVQTARRMTHAQGAGESGMSRLLEMHAFNTAGDAAVAISSPEHCSSPCPPARPVDRLHSSCC
ncbi:MAG: hypothetical protein WKF83_08055 [Nocardioidaceae bacterium]